MASKDARPPVSKQVRDRLESKLSYMEQVQDKASTQWRLWLTVGNGAGLVLVGGALINAWKLQPFLVLLPALWLFAIGLICGGALAFVSARGFYAIQERAEAEIAKYDGATKIIEASGKHLPIDDVITRHAGEHVLLGHLETVVEFIAAAAFASGVLWPLVQITFFFVAPAGQ